MPRFKARPSVSIPPCPLRSLPEPELVQIQKTRGVTWRSVLLGTFVVIAICTLTPINDFTLSNTSLAAGFVPLAAVLVLFLLVVVINAPLHRFAPRHALSSGELAVVVLMSFIACGLSNWGLMRFFIPTPVAPFHLGATDETYLESVPRNGSAQVALSG